ncbi:aspartate/glutamate racemase family protein [Phaeacidiphilus oryzae]|jgi:Asp/Glu/hydantoin racemase|uniref:aspartate/glutamate racemase family protein n=1 Tax=Phaeacidiphilus oryzae TaxID=348818 RepID=UPI0005674E51|nr:aspartate/glutamate racemase family protein [Phaeacidiphilus oryzae]
MADMNGRVALLYTDLVLVPFTVELARTELPGLRVMNIVDDAILAGVRGGTMDQVDLRRRILEHALRAEEAGADAVLCTCSSVSDAAAAVAPLLRVPLLRIDDAMVAEAVENGGDIGVVATVETAADEVVGKIEALAGERGVVARVRRTVVPGAFDALSRGDAAAHDEAVLKTVHDELTRSDFVVLAQASMERVVAALDDADRPRVGAPLRPAMRGLMRHQRTGGGVLV